MWKGKAAILNPNPAKARSPSSSSGSPGGPWPWPRRRDRSSRWRRTRTTGRRPSRAEDTLPTRKNFSADSPAASSPLDEARQHVERDGHQLEGDEEQDDVARGRQHQHAEQRGQDEQVVLERPAREGGPGSESPPRRPMNVAARKSRLAKRASPSCTNMAPAPGSRPATGRASARPGRARRGWRATQRSDDPRRARTSPATKTHSSTIPSPHSSAKGEPSWDHDPEKKRHGRRVHRCQARCREPSRRRR